MAIFFFIPMISFLSATLFHQDHTQGDSIQICIHCLSLAFHLHLQQQCRSASHTEQAPFKYQNKQVMEIGDSNYPLAQGVILIILVLSIAFTTFLFRRGGGNYSIKYEIMRRHRFFRENQWAVLGVEFLYKMFFILPFILLAVVAIMRAIDDVRNLATVLINGLIILLVIYPIKRELFYLRLAAIWVLIVGSQFSTLFISLRNSSYLYLTLSVIFYTANVSLFFIGLLSIEATFWEISQGINKFKDQVAEVNSQWVKGKDFIPKIFDGGLYGHFCRARSYKPYAIFYLLSVAMLIVYAFLVRIMVGSNLGFVGLVSNLIYDIFIKIFNRLESRGRSINSLFLMLVAGRLLSFVFGIELWLLGYCILYFGLAIFMGWMIIDKNWPLKPESKDRNRKTSNAFSTPEFVLLVLTIQIIVMILVEVYALKTSDQVDYNGVVIPIWQWGLLAVVAAWAIIIYLISMRILLRHRNKIHALTEYYFGLPSLTEYHAFLFLSYIVVIALGLYSHFYLRETAILVSCIFIPLIYLCLLSISNYWEKNDYQILADTDEYNKQQEKKRKIKVKQIEMLEKNTKIKGKKRDMMLSKIRSSTHIKDSQGEGFFGGIKNQIKNFKQEIGDELMRKDDDQDMRSGNTSNHELKAIQNQQKIQMQETKELKYKLKQIQLLRNWRQLELTGVQAWHCFTPNDKTLIRNILLLILELTAYCLASSLWAKSKFGISFTVCLLAFLSLAAYYRYYKTKAALLVSEIVMLILGFALGIIYWSVFHKEVIGPIVFGILYAVLAGYLLQKLLTAQQISSKFPLILLSTLILLSLIFVLIIMGVHRGIVLVTTFSVIFFILLILMIPLYFKLTQGFVKKRVYLPVGAVIVALVVVLSIIGFVRGVLTSFAIFTIVMALLFFAFFASSIMLAYSKSSKENQNPQVFCAYGETHFRFESAKQTLKSNTNHIVLYSFALIALAVYATVVANFFDPKEWSVIVFSLCWLMELWETVIITMSTYFFIGKCKKKGFVTDQLVLDSFMKLKNEYMIDEVEGEDSPEYFVKLNDAKEAAEKKSTNQTWKNVVMMHDLYIQNVKEEQKFLFFWIALIKFNLIAKKRQIQLQTLTELREISAQLEENGIFLSSIELNLPLNEKYKKAIKQVQQLEAFDTIIYEQILEKHRADESGKKKMFDELRKKEEEKDKERDEQLYKQMKNVKVDSQEEIQKFNELITNLGRRNLFTDEEFPANQMSLGGLSSFVDSWRRPNVGEVLSKGGIGADDVKQGMIGDCYLISSLGVLGEKRIMQALGYDESGQERWVNSKGAYMVRYFKFGKQCYVVIDDQLPINEDKQWVFAKSNEPTEFWPCILQKSYAKLYGGYHNIVQGKCHRVLSEFTGGFPFQILLDEYTSNPNGLWTQIISAIKNGYLLGAGTPPHANGDKAWSKRGIVYGHAYCVLDAVEAEGHKIVKIKNPHGSGGLEWIGDFSDKSQLMTKRMMGILNHSQSDDGIFWMPIEDFIKEYKSLYMCVVFDQRWKKFGPIANQWTEENSMGTPNNQGCEKNPHYGITVTKKCNIFISLTQDAVSALKGKNFIYMRIQRNQGRRMRKQDICSDNLVGKPQRPRDAVMVSTEIQLEADSYPYTFSVMLCCKDVGSTGSFWLELYCDDPSSEIIQDKDFDAVQE